MGHSHSSHSHHHSPGTKPLGWLAGLTLLYMVVEIIGGMVSGSLALLADAGHMAIDSAAILLGLFAIWISRRPATAAKTYGYYRVEILAALVNGVLLVVAALWIFYEAWVRIWEPRDINAEIMAVVSSGGLIVNLIGIYLVSGHHKESLNIRAVWLHLLTDLLGSLASLGAAGLLLVFGWRFADPLVGFVVGVFILFGAWRLLSDCVNVLLEGVPKSLDLSKIRNHLESFPPVEEVHDLHVWTVSYKVHALSAHIILKEGANLSLALERVIELLKCEFAIEHVTLQLEPADFTHRETLHLHA